MDERKFLSQTLKQAETLGVWSAILDVQPQGDVSDSSFVM